MWQVKNTPYEIFKNFTFDTFHPKMLKLNRFNKNYFLAIFSKMAQILYMALNFIFYFWCSAINPVASNPTPLMYFDTP
jgi:hypothetical protein